MDEKAFVVSTDLVEKLILGVLAMFSSMVGLLVWLVRRQTDHVERLTAEFTSTLRETINKNTEAGVGVTNALAGVTIHLAELTATLREFMAQQREADRNIMDAIGKSRRDNVEVK